MNEIKISTAQRRARREVRRITAGVLGVQPRAVRVATGEGRPQRVTTGLPDGWTPERIGTAVEYLGRALSEREPWRVNLDQERRRLIAERLEPLPTLLPWDGYTREDGQVLLGTGRGPGGDLGPVCWDPRSDPHVLLAGGSGKTSAARLIVGQWVQSGGEVVVLTDRPEYAALADVLAIAEIEEASELLADTLGHLDDGGHLLVVDPVEAVADLPALTTLAQVGSRHGVHLLLLTERAHMPALPGPLQAVVTLRALFQPARGSRSSREALGLPDTPLEGGTERGRALVVGRALPGPTEVQFSWPGGESEEVV